MNQTSHAPQSARSVPSLTDDLRPGLRLQAAWMICFQSWLQSVSGKEAREWLKDKETFLRHMDSLTWQTLAIVLETPQEPDDWAEALRMVMPNQEEESTSAELDEDQPLTPEEWALLEAWAEEANGSEQ